jgi:hypothetical protein
LASSGEGSSARVKTSARCTPLAILSTDVLARRRRQGSGRSDAV